ncbi:PLP-dependent aminotransferase family protein [Undibacterium sp. TS12]|uniref:aminotransferase-like domain-containing protein n=1 Tax=Undibacterium sp. TS12 TaxID=2908202 RepID=UPI001F4C6E84|nr:PLP-dependent aminotransferase family protein [Undibacterium sp. TS12]MCH8620013.1 PLP-dependent aminotransferase family protein [Undibacterium sp. TS12]
MQHSYRQQADLLEREIRAGSYQVGERLPSVRVFAGAQQVSVSTAIRCYRYLESLGLVEARNKSGIYVADWKSRTKQPDHGSKTKNHPPVVEYDKLMSLQHRMTELYSLTAQPLQWGLHLASAAPEWYPCEALSKIAQRQLRQQPLQIGEYPTGTGLPALKTSLVQWLATCGVDLAPADLLVTNGSTEALSVALRAVAQPGEAVIVESPVYFGLLQTIENLGLKAIEIPCVPGAGISLEALEYALEHQSGVRAVVAMPNFQNPLGCAMPEKNKRRLLKLVEQHDLALIEDDVFGDLSHQQERPQPVKAWDRQGRVIYCGSCSKSLAPGFRIGWIAGGRYQARITSLKLTSSLITPLFEQAVLAEFMQSGALPSHIRKLRERLAANIPLAKAAIERYFPLGTQVVSPAGGWWLWLELPEQVDSLVLLRRAVGQGIAFTPGSLFSGSGKYANYLRMNIGRPWGREMEQGIKVLGKLAREFSG